MTGTNFDILGSGFEALCQFQGLYSDSTTVTSTSIDCAFNSGIPNTGVSAVKPKLVYRSVDPTSTIAHWAVVEPTAAFENPLVASTVEVKPSSCAFTGGCPLYIKAPGLTANFITSEVSIIKIYDVECKFSAALSNDTYVVCFMPAILTDTIQKYLDEVYPQLIQNSNTQV